MFVLLFKPVGGYLIHESNDSLHKRIIANYKKGDNGELLATIVMRS